DAFLGDLFVLAFDQLAQLLAAARRVAGLVTAALFGSRFPAGRGGRGRGRRRWWRCGRGGFLVRLGLGLLRGLGRLRLLRLLALGRRGGFGGGLGLPFFGRGGLFLGHGPCSTQQRNHKSPTVAGPPWFGGL